MDVVEEDTILQCLVERNVHYVQIYHIQAFMFVKHVKVTNMCIYTDLYIYEVANTMTVQWIPITTPPPQPSCPVS